MGRPDEGGCLCNQQPNGQGSVGVISNQTVRVQWESQFVDHFETGDFSLFDWNNAVSDYPWEITDSQSFDGSLSMRASNAGVDNSTSAIQIKMPIPRDCEMRFYGKISSENNWDLGKFYIDGECMTSQSGQGSWHEFRYDVTEGEVPWTTLGILTASILFTMALFISRKVGCIMDMTVTVAAWVTAAMPVNGP